MNDNEQKVLKIYFDTKMGFTNPNEIYKKLNKSVKLKDIKQIIERTKNKQIFAQKPEKQRQIPISNPRRSYQFDLTFYTQYKSVNNGYHILLCIIDTNTKYVYVYAMKDKTQDTILNCLQKFFDKEKDVYLMQTDNESGVGNKIKKLIKDNGVILRMFNKQESPNAIMIVERFNRTIRLLIDNYMQAYNTHKFIDVLPNLVYNYNNRFHSSINMTPQQAKNKNFFNYEVFNKKQDILQQNELQIPINGQARIYKDRDLFQKGQINATEELYDIKQQNGNYFVLQHGNDKEQLVPPSKIKLIQDEVLANPLLPKRGQKKQKIDLEQQKKENKQYRQLNKEGLDNVVQELKQNKDLEIKKQQQQAKLKRMGIDQNNVIK